MGLCCGSYSACHCTPSAKPGASAIRIASIVPSSATPSTTTRFARFEDALTVQRIDADGLATEQPGKGAAGNETDVMPVGEDDVGIRMDFAVLQPRHAMVHASGQLADFRMQRAAEGDVHLLQAAADTEQRYAAGDASFR